MLEDFDDIQTEEPLLEVSSPEEKTVSINGWTKIGSSWNFAHEAPASGDTDWRGLSKLRTELFLAGKVKLAENWQAYLSAKGEYDWAFRAKGRSDYSDDVLNAYESDLDVRDTYIAGSLSDNIDIKAGRQTVVWGRSDNLRLTDVLNPLDNREPGLTDIEDLRRPVGMIKLDGYSGPWNISALYIPEIRFDRVPVFGHDFYGASTRLPEEEIPDDGFRNTEYGLALNGTFPGWDFSLYGADIYSDIPHYTADNSQLKHSRLKMLGGAGNYTVGDTLLFAEAAYSTGYEFQAVSDRDFSKLEFLGGLEYSGFTDTTISMEAAHHQILNYIRELETTTENIDEKEFEWAFRLQRSFMRERLELTYLAVLQGITGNDGKVQRFQADYELADALELRTGLVLYHSGQRNGFQGIGSNDRFFVELKYSF